MKRLLCAALAVVTVLSLAACAKTPAPDAAPDDTPETPEYFVVEDGVYRAEDELDGKSIDRAFGKFQKFTEDYCTEGNRVLFALLPTKSSYLPAGTVPAPDEEALFTMASEMCTFAPFLDLRPCLDLEDYYRTDPHWRQEQLGDVVAALSEALEIDIDTENRTSEVLTEHYIGVYGAEVDGIAPETMTVLRHPAMDGYIVRSGETGEEIPLYDTAKLTERDPYELFAGGPLSLVTIENPNAPTDRRLIVVRDSFASALLPLLAQSYAEVTAVDIRYMMPAMVGQHVDFTDADVLFLYSSTVINNSITLK